MFSQFNKLISSALVALLFCALPAPLFAADYNSSALTQNSPSIRYAASARHEPTFDATDLLTLQKDMLFTMERMAGILDRYSGSGFPAECDEFVSYHLLLDGRLFEMSFLDIPPSWNDIVTMTRNSGEAVVTKGEPVVLTCANGGHGSLSQHNRETARLSLNSSMQTLQQAIRGTEERGAVSAESTLENEIDNPTSNVNIDDLWRQGGHFEFNSTDLYLDMLLSQGTMRELGGLIDRVLAGNSADCAALTRMRDLINQPILFTSVPSDWKPIYNGHLDSILTALDTSGPLAALCLSGNMTADSVQVKNARFGLDQAMQTLAQWIEVIEERIEAENHL
ncbi:MAG: hypothetical protein ACPG8W_07820 [Candidatus Promineifilaceae bacterium]